MFHFYLMVEIRTDNVDYVVPQHSLPLLVFREKHSITPGDVNCSYVELWSRCMTVNGHRSCDKAEMLHRVLSVETSVSPR